MSGGQGVASNVIIRLDRVIQTSFLRRGEVASPFLDSLIKSENDKYLRPHLASPLKGEEI
jgi:hypothetical protein